MYVFVVTNIILSVTELCSTSVCCKAAASYKELKVLQPVRRSQDKEV